jgi:hypothetical protein
MRDRTPRAQETAAPPATSLSPAEGKLSQLHALADKIQAMRSDLDTYLEERARILAGPGVPMVSIKQMLEGRARGCLCLGATLALSDQIAALELEEKQRGAIPEG